MTAVSPSAICPNTSNGTPFPFPLRIKYQDQGGPSIVDCVRALQDLRIPAVDVIGFIDRVIFNFLIGNSDAHGKNFSVIYRTRAPRLAPVYDALCTTIYPAIAKRMAMKFDGKFEFRWVTPGKIARTFARADIGEKVIFDSIERQIAALRKNIPTMSDLADSEHPSPVYHDIIKGIFSRINQLASE